MPTPIDNLLSTLAETVDELRRHITTRRDALAQIAVFGCVTDLATGVTHCCQSGCEVHTNYALNREDFRRLLTQSIEFGKGTPHSVSLSLDSDARMIADLIANAELTDPRGVMDARLSRLRVAHQDALEERTSDAWDELERVFETVILS